MQIVMSNLRRIAALFVLVTPFVFFYSWTLLSSIRRTTPVPVLYTLPPTHYKVVELNDRVPSIKLATDDGNKPYADGDRAQIAIIDSLKLVNKCKQDPSLIVVDIGGFLGNYNDEKFRRNLLFFFIYR